MSIGQGLANLGAIYGGYENTVNSAQDRQRANESEQLRLQALRQTMAQQQQQQEQQRISFEAQQAALARDRAAAGAAVGAFQSPQQVPMPGAQPMPQGMRPPRPPMGGAPMPGGMPGVMSSGGLSRQPGSAAMDPRSGMQPPMTPQGPPQGPQGGQPPSVGGMSLQQLADNIHQHLGPDADPLTVLDAMGKYQGLLKAPEQEKLNETKLEIQKLVAEARVMAAGNQGEKAGVVTRRELDMKALGLGIDGTGKTDEQLRKEVAAKSGSQLDLKDAKRAKPTVAEWRYDKGKTEAAEAAKNIKQILAAHPNAVGVYGKIYKGIGGAKGLLKQPSPQDTDAANALNVQFEKLYDAMGVAASAGGMGASTMTKRWDNTIGGTDWLTNPQKLNTYLDSISGDLDRFKGQYTPPADAVREEEPNAALDAALDRY